MSINLSKPASAQPADGTRLLGQMMADADRLGLEMTGITGVNLEEVEVDELAAARFSLLVELIRSYAQSTSSEYTEWSVLSNDIGEQFEMDWINPTPEQLKYIEARNYVREVEAADLWSVRSDPRRTHRGL